MKACKRYRQLIAAYVDGTASAEERSRLELHLAECEACARETRELARTRELVTSLPDLRPSPGLMSSISARLRERPVGLVERLWWSFRPADWRLPVAAAVLLLLCVGAGILTLHGPGTTPQHPGQEAWVAQVYSGPSDAIAELPPDDYVTSCVLIHETFDENRAFGTPEEVQLVSHGQ